MGPCHVSKPGGLRVSSALTKWEQNEPLLSFLLVYSDFSEVSGGRVPERHDQQKPLTQSTPWFIHQQISLHFFFFFSSSASPVYIDIWAEHLSSFFLSPDCYVCVGSSGKYFPGDTKIFNSGFLLSMSTWHMPDCISLLISDVICDPNGHRRPEDCVEGYIAAVVIPATLFSELVLLNNSRDEVQPMLRGI